MSSATSADVDMSSGTAGLTDERTSTSISMSYSDLLLDKSKALNSSSSSINALTDASESLSSGEEPEVRDSNFEKSEIDEATNLLPGSTVTVLQCVLMIMKYGFGEPSYTPFNFM